MCVLFEWLLYMEKTNIKLRLEWIRGLYQALIAHDSGFVIISKNVMLLNAQLKYNFAQHAYKPCRASDSMTAFS